MLKKAMVAGLIMLSAVALTSPANVDAAKVKKCHGKVATQVLTSSGTLYFTEGDDVFVGSNENDDFLLAEGDTPSGTDIVCGGSGEDAILAVGGPGSIADGGSGSDMVAAVEGALALGGAGDDFLVVAAYGGKADGGSGNEGNSFLIGDLPLFSDYLDFFGDNAEILQYGGVWALYGSTADGGSGNDLVGGIEAGTLLGGSGSDEVVVFGPADRVDCGPNGDIVYYADAGSSETERRCEERGID